MVCENNHYSTTHYSSLDGVQHNIIELTDLDIIFTLKPIENYKRVKKFTNLHFLNENIFNVEKNKFYKLLKSYINNKYN